MKVFKDGIIRAGLMALKKYGLAGYDKNWCDGYNSFPIASFIFLLGSSEPKLHQEDIFRSDIHSEIGLLNRYLSE